MEDDQPQVLEALDLCQDAPVLRQDEPVLQQVVPDLNIPENHEEDVELAQEDNAIIED